VSLPTLIADIVAVIAPVFVIAALGYGWARAKLPFDGSFVTTFMINVATPCLVFSTLARLRFEGAELATMLLASIACMALAAAIGAAVLRLFRLSLQVYLPALTFPNAGNMGMPLCLFAFGEQGLGLAVMYFSALSAVQFTLGPAIAAGKPDFWQMLRTPVIYAVALALLLRAVDLEVPRWAAISALRLGLGFGVGLVVVWALDLEGAARGVVLLESSMPVAVFNYLWAVRYNNAPEEVAGLVLGSTALSFLTLPLLLLAVM
jgi:predicted permease